MGYLFDTGSSFMYKLAITFDLVMILVPIIYPCEEHEISWVERTRKSYEENNRAFVWLPLV
jgi:hypothetical protein